MLDFIADTSIYRAVRRTDNAERELAPHCIRNILNSLPVVHGETSTPQRQGCTKVPHAAQPSDSAAPNHGNAPNASPLLPLDLLQAYVGFGRSHLYALIARGEFPQPVKIGRSSRWPLHEVEAWIHDRIADRDAIGGVTK